MHPRSYLHRTADTPRASAGTNGPEAQHPLGFADVRSDAPVEASSPRRPVGFAPAEPQFVTELSFRRTPAVATTQPALQPAEVEQPVPATTAPGTAGPWRPAPQVTAVAAAQAESPRAEERVPFYKREITLRRRKPEPQVGAIEADEFTVEPQAAMEEDASMTESAHPIGFAASDDADADADADRDAEPEPEGEEASADHAPVAEVVEPEPVDEADADSIAPLADADPDDVEDAELEELAPHADAGDAASEPLGVETEGELEAELEAEPAEEAALVDEPDAVEHAEPADEMESTLAEDEADDEPEPEAAPADLDQDASLGADPVAAEIGTGKRSSIRARRGGKPKAKASGPRAPRSGGRKAVGLKIGASQLAAAVVAHADGRDQLVSLVREPLEAGIVVDGEVRDAEALREAIKSFFDAHKLPRRDVRIGVASNRIGVRTVDIAGVDDAERFDNAVRFKAHEVLPVSVSESVLDYRVIEERVTETGDVVKRVLLVVAPRDQVEPFARAAQGAGLKLAGIDLEALGLLRAFVEPQAPGSRAASDTATVVVAIGHESTTLLVSGGGTCEFTRVFDWGGLALEQAIALELDLTLGEAQNVLHGLSLVGPGTTLLEEDSRVRALDAVRARLTPFARELVSSLQFYQAQSGSLGIGEIVITGGTSHLEGLADALHQMIGVQVRVGDPLARLSVPFAVDPAIERTIGSLAVPVGLAIEDDALRGVNLLPQELKGQRKKVNPLHVALPIAAVVPIAAMGFLFFQAGGEVSDRQSEIAAVQAQIDALPEPTRPTIDPSLAVDQQARASALATVLGSRLQWDRVLGDVSRVLPRNVWLTHFTAKTPDPTGAALPTAVAPAAPSVPPTPTGVTIEGYTYDLTDVAVLIARLETVPTLTSVSLATTENRKLGKKKVVSFTIMADLDQNGGAQ